MSLLLDALKKAADDKQKVSQSEPVSAESAAIPARLKLAEEITSRAGLTAENETSNFSESLLQEIPQQAAADELDDSEALTLDPVASVQTESVLTLDETDIESDIENGSAGPEQHAEKKDKKPVGSKAVSNNSVSDEALLLLINKANRDVKNSKRIIVVSVLLASLAVMFFGGIYYYFEMQAEMASLERKHQIAMQAMRLKTSDEKVPEKSEIIRSFVNKSEPEEKVKLAKQHMLSKKVVSEKRIQKKVESRAATKKQANAARNNTDKENTLKNDKSAVSIQRTNKSDPIGEKLDAAWLAYESGQYDAAEMQYAGVLHLEKNNRDAMLGLGAIAIHNKDARLAKRYYLALLKQDPRDPIATAAIASLHSDKTSIEADEENLLSALQKNPSAHHLNFALGNIYAQQNNWKSAQQYYFNAWQNNNENADYVFNLAVSMDQLSKQQQAIEFYKECLLKSNNKQVSFSREAVKKRISELSGM
jgi:tetratricopeptide (TPR) repeat protein